MAELAIETPAGLIGMIGLDGTAELARARQAELLHCTALAGRSELVAEIGLAAGFALVLVAPTELIESTEALEILVEPSTGTLIVSPAALAELAEMLEPVELLELAALLIEPVGPVGLAVLLVETPAGLAVVTVELVGRPCSKR